MEMNGAESNGIIIAEEYLLENVITKKNAECYQTAQQYKCASWIVGSPVD